MWSDSVPDWKTIGLFRDLLFRRGQVNKCFRRCENYLNEAGLMGHEGTMSEASWVDVRRQRNSREEHEEIKEGTVPESFQKNENPMEQQDVAARWAKKAEDVHGGYKNHVRAGRTTKLIEDDAVTDARVHDSQAVEDLVETDDRIVHADSAYTGEAIETILEENGVAGEMYEKGYRHHSLTKAQKKRNRTKSAIKVRVEPMFWFMTQTMKDGLKLRWMGMPRITAGIGRLNLVYSLARYEQILGIKPA